MYQQNTQNTLVAFTVFHNRISYCFVFSDITIPNVRSVDDMQLQISKTTLISPLKNTLQKYSYYWYYIITSLAKENGSSITSVRLLHKNIVQDVMHNNNHMHDK